MKDYVKTFTNTSITTDQWYAHLFDFFGKQPNSAEYLKKLAKVDFDEVSVSQATVPLRCRLWYGNCSFRGSLKPLPVHRYAHTLQWLHGDGLDLCVKIEYDDSLSKPVSRSRSAEQDTPLTLIVPGARGAVEQGPRRQRPYPVLAARRGWLQLDTAQRIPRCRWCPERLPPRDSRGSG